MTDRDKIAIEAMKSMLLMSARYGSNPETIAKLSYKMADEMLKINRLPSEIICNQFWAEDAEDKTGWAGSGWITEDIDSLEKYELHKVTEADKYEHPTKAIFKLRA